MDSTHSFGYWVRRQRKALDLTQRELARRAACSLSAIKKIEQDARRPSVQLAEILADSLLIAESERDAFLCSARGLAPTDKLPLPNQPLASAEASVSEALLGEAGNLPAEVTPIFGRDEEAAQLRDQLLAQQVRLITVFGPGGVGKTCLSLLVARLAQSSFNGGAWFVPLAGVSDPADLSAAIALAMGFSFAGPLEPEQQLVRQLQGRQLLLLLDNFEQLLPAGAELISFLIRSLPELTILATSRERLRLKAETTMPLKGIPQDAARALFLETARRVGGGPDLASTKALSGVDQICTLVEGFPLAIELAASWANVMTPAEIHSELNQGLDLLEVVQGDRPQRHLSMRAVFAGSWKRLAPKEQLLLASLSIFAHSFTRAAAHEVCAASMTQLASLHAHALIRREHGRFNLHEVIRHFAAEKLAAKPDLHKLIQEKHAAYYCQFMNRIAALFKSGAPELSRWDTAIDAEIDNIRVAWHWLIDNEQPHRLCRAAMTLWLYQDLRGLAREGLSMSSVLGACAARLRSAGVSKEVDLLRRTEAMALLGQGAHTMRAGRRTDSRALLDRANTLLDGLHAPEERVALIGLLGPVVMQSSSAESGEQELQESLALALREGHVWGAGLGFNFLGLFHFSRGRPAEARDALLKAVSIWKDHSGLAYCLVRSKVHLGLVYHALGAFTAAVTEQEEALTLALAYADHSFIPLAHCNLGFHYYALSRHDLARLQFERGLAAAQQFDLHASAGHSLLGLGLVAAATGKHSLAVTLFMVGTAQAGPYNTFLLGEPQRTMNELRRTLATEAFAAAKKQAARFDVSSYLA